jgi:rubredoxin
MTQWVCTICKWTYYTGLGLPENDIDPGTPFENLPNDFRCCECGAQKKWFEKAKK